MTLRVAIVGSTDLTVKQTETAYELIEGILLFELNQIPGTAVELVSGGADGVDKLAEEAVEMLDLDWLVTPKIFLPEIDIWEHATLKGYRVRNLEIANYCDKLWRISSVQSKTYGSGWTADRAEEMGKSVNRITI